MEQDSFIRFIEEYGDARPPSMAYDGQLPFSEWQDALQDKINALRGPLPDRVPVAIEVLREEECGAYRRQRINIAVSEFGHVPALLLVPNNIDHGEQRPAIIASHGHHHRGMESVCGSRGDLKPGAHLDDYGRLAVESGYVVLAPAWWGWQGRDGHTACVGNRDKCNVIQMAAAMYGFHVLDLHIQDAQAAVDALCTFDFVDNERIACMGNSYGGRSTMWISIFEKRIKAIVAAGCMNTFRERSLKLSSCDIQCLPGLLQYADVPEVFCLLAPRPLQLQVGKKDSLITPSDRDEMIGKIRSAYNSCGADAALDYVLHDDGHILHWQYVETFLQNVFKE